MDPSYFSPDTSEFIRLLAEHKVHYLIVGGEAVIFYGYARLTGDVDFYYDRTQENTENLYSALKDFWQGEVPGIKDSSELMQKGIVFQFGRPPNRIDLINVISGVEFDKAWQNRTLEEVEIKKKKYPLFYIGLEELIQNKKKAKRFKDLEDLKYLTVLIDQQDQ